MKTYLHMLLRCKGANLGPALDPTEHNRIQISLDLNMIKRQI